MIEDIATIVGYAEDGLIPANEVYLQLHTLKKAVDDCLSQVKPLAMQEVAKYGKDGWDAGDKIVTIKSGGGRWDYSGVSLYQKLQTQMDHIAELAQLASKSGGFATNEDGEVIEPAVYKNNADTIVVNQKRNA
jgi:hypothetical protein